MKYPTISNRIITGSGIIVTALIILFMLFINDLKKIENLNQKIIEHPFTVSNAVKDINIRINGIHRTMKDIARASSENDLNNLVSLVNMAENEVLDLFEIVEEQYLGDSKDVEVAYKMFTSWHSIRQEVIDLSKQGKNEEAYEITTGKGAKHIDSLLNRISVLNNFASAKAIEFQANSKSIIEKTTRQSILLLAFFILIIMASLFWIFVSVRKPLYKITQKIKHISEKEPGINPIPKTKNMIEILDTMVSNMDKVVATLEDRINKRTEEIQEEKEFTEMALNHQTDTFLVVDVESKKAIRWNKAFRDACGYTDEEIQQLTAPDSYYSEKDMERIREITAKAPGEDVSFISNLITKDKKNIPFEYHLSPIYDKQSKKVFVVSIGRDITQRLIDESELEKHRKHLQEMVDEQTTEIQAANEELITANEEQATMNKELTAANEELSTALEQLAKSNEDLERTTLKLTKSNKELLEANKELERFNQLFIDREFRIKELKEKIKKLENNIRE